MEESLSVDSPDRPETAGSKKHRIKRLWRKLRIASYTIARLIKVSKNVKTYGVSNPHYCLRAGLKQFQDQKVVPPRGVFLPHSKSKQVWDLVLCVLLIWSATVVPLNVCFSDESVKWEVLDSVVNALFICDIFITFLSAYYDNDSKLVVSHRQIASHYMKTWLLIDVISWCEVRSFPSQAFDQTHSSVQSNSLVRLMRLPRLYRLVKFVRFFKSFHLSNHRSCAWLLARTINIDPTTKKVFRFIILLALLSHLVACLWFFTARISDFDEKTWVARYGQLDLSVAEQYVTSLYFVLTTLATVGYGDIVPMTYLERGFAIAILMFGVGFYSYSISNFEIITGAAESRDNYLISRLETLSDIVKTAKLSPASEKKARYFLYQNLKHRFYARFNQEAVMQELPAFLRTEISLYMYHGFVQKVYFFQDKDPAFIASVAAGLRNVLLHKGNLIYREYDFAEEVYFLMVGRVNCEISSGMVFTTFVQGSYFGEVEILAGRLRTSTAVIATNTAEFLILPKAKFLKMLEDFPKIAEEILNTALLRSKEYGLRKEEALRKQRIPVPKINKKSTSSSPDTEDNPEKSRLWNNAKDLIKKENFRKMWKKAGARRFSQTSKWDAVLRSLFPEKQSTHRRKSIISAAAIPSLTAKLMRSYLLERFLKKFPAVKREKSKWNVVRDRLKEITPSIIKSDLPLRFNKPMLQEIRVKVAIDPPDEVLDDHPEILVTPRDIQNSGLLIALKEHNDFLKGQIETIRIRLAAAEQWNRKMRKILLAVEAEIQETEGVEEEPKVGFTN